MDVFVYAYICCRVNSLRCSKVISDELGGRFVILVFCIFSIFVTSHFMVLFNKSCPYMLGNGQCY